MKKNLPAIILILYALLLALGIFWGLPSEFVPEIDCEVPLGPLRFFGDIHSSTVLTQYPALTYLLPLPLYTVALGILKITGQLGALSGQWPFGFTDPVFGLSLLTVISRALSICFGLGVLWIVYRFVKTITKSTRIGLLFSLLIMGSGVMTFYGRAANNDMQFIFFWLAGFYLLYRYCFEQQTMRLLVASALLSAAAAATKDQGIAFCLANGLILLFADKAPFGKRFRHSVVFGGITLGAYGLLAIAPQPWRFVEHVRLVLASKEFLQQIQTGHYNAGPAWIALSYTSFKYLSWICSPAGLLLGFVGLFGAIKSRGYALALFFILPTICFYALFVGATGAIHERYLINTALSITLLGAFGFDALVKKSDSQIKSVLMILLAGSVIGQYVFGAFPVTLAQNFNGKQKLAQELSTRLRSGSDIEWVGRLASLPNSAVYNKYHLAVADSLLDAPGSKRLKLIFKPLSQITTPYVLSDHPLHAPQLELITAVKNTAYSEQFSTVYEAAHAASTFFVSHRYYLYKRIE